MTDHSAAGRNPVDAFALFARFAPLIFLVILMAVFWALNPRFVLPLNLFNIMLQVSIYGLLAIGMTFVILTAGIDLSIGSLLAMAGLVAAAGRRAACQPLHCRRRCGALSYLVPRSACRDRRRPRRRLRQGSAITRS
jgi:predicted ABC-type sugar transport system permease subunit